MTTNRFLKELLRAFLLGIVVFIGFLIYYYFAENWRFDAMVDNFWEEILTTVLFTIIIYLANMSWFLFLLRKWDHYLYTLKRMSIALVGNVIITCLAVFIGRIIIFFGYYNQPFQEVVNSNPSKDYIQPVFITIVFSVLFYAFWYNKYKQENKVKEQKIIAGTASAKFDALKNQLDPHFLFNSLNVLTSLIEEDPHKAQKFTTSLSKVYRYVLEQKNKDLVTVDEELQFARTYVRLLKMRFEDSIVFEIPEKSSVPEAKIVPLSLQLLLENAVKHNVVTAEKPLHIKVFEKGGMLHVSNNFQEKQFVKKSSGVGLTNIQQRYGILTDRRVHIEKSNSDFSVQLPILTKKVSKIESQEAFLEDKRYEKAKERVAKIKGFYANLTTYCIVIPVLIFINYQTTSFPWAIFPALGWGFGLTGHGLEAFGYHPIFGKNWEERKMREYMEDENF